MKTRLEEAEVKGMVNDAEAAVCLGYCAVSRLFRNAELVGYTCGVYGWNYDVFRAHGVIVCTGYRDMMGEYSPTLDNITAKYESLAKKHARRNPWPRDEKRDNRMKEYLIERWAREIKAALNK